MYGVSVESVEKCVEGGKGRGVEMWRSLGEVWKSVWGGCGSVLGCGRVEERCG